MELCKRRFNGETFFFQESHLALRRGRDGSDSMIRGAWLGRALVFIFTSNNLLSSSSFEEDEEEEEVQAEKRRYYCEF